MISLSNIVFEIKQLISKEDLEDFNDIDDFIKTNGDLYLDMRLKKRYCEFIVKPIPVSDFKAVLPKFNEIVQVSGSDNLDLRNRYYNDWFVNSEVAAWMRKDYNDNVYTVIKNKGKCAKDECDTELIINAELFHQELAQGGNYNLIKKMYHHKETDEIGCSRSALDREFYLMSPTESNLFGLQEQFIKDCINFEQNRSTGGKYDFDIRYSSTDKSKVIKTNFREGIILLSYYGNVYDEEGYLMFPEYSELIMATRYFIQMMIFEKLANQYKTNDYANTLNRTKRSFLEYNSMAVSKLNNYSFNELAPIIARAKFHSNHARTYEGLINRDYPDRHRERMEESTDY